MNSTSIEDFATLCASLEEGPSSRARILAEAGLDGSAYDALQRRWLPLLASGEDAALAHCFGRAYARARLRLMAPEEERTQELAPGHAGAPVLPFAVAIAPRRASADATLELKTAPSTPPLPFSPPAPGNSRRQLYDTQTGAPLAAPVWKPAPKR